MAVPVTLSEQRIEASHGGSNPRQYPQDLGCTELPISIEISSRIQTTQFWADIPLADPVRGECVPLLCAKFSDGVRGAPYLLKIAPFQTPTDWFNVLDRCPTFKRAPSSRVTCGTLDRCAKFSGTYTRRLDFDWVYCSSCRSLVSKTKLALGEGTLAGETLLGGCIAIKSVFMDNRWNRELRCTSQLNVVGAKLPPVCYAGNGVDHMSPAAIAVLHARPGTPWLKCWYQSRCQETSRFTTVFRHREGR